MSFIIIVSYINIIIYFLCYNTYAFLFKRRVLPTPGPCGRFFRGMTVCHADFAVMRLSRISALFHALGAHLFLGMIIMG